jgi:hypothetical protein
MESNQTSFVNAWQNIDRGMLALKNEQQALVRQVLARLGYLRLPWSILESASASMEKYDIEAETAQALRVFQRFYDLEPTGRADSLTMEVLTQPRCGMADQRVRFQAKRCAWGKQELTYTFTNTSQDLPALDASKAVERAFHTWEGLGMITFREVSVGELADVEVRWTTAAENDFLLSGDVVAHADYPPGCDQVVSSGPKPIHFEDSDHFWADGKVLEAFDIETVALHEIGHILGLDHSPNRNDAMYPLLVPDLIKRDLTKQDEKEFFSLYPNQP